MDYVPNTKYMISQDKECFSYGTDALLLTEFARPRGLVIDIGCGNGIIPLRIADNRKVRKIIGIEIQDRAYRLACENIKLNGLENKIEIINDNINAFAPAHKDMFDTVITNPPYMRVNTGEMVKNDNFSIARHERFLNLRQLMKSASMMLKSKGDFFMIHRANRIADIIYEMKSVKIEPKEIQIVRNNLSSLPYMILISGKKCGAEGVLYKPDIYLCDYSNRKK